VLSFQFIPLLSIARKYSNAHLYPACPANTFNMNAPEFGWAVYIKNETRRIFASPTIVLSSAIAVLTFLLYRTFSMAEATAADGQMKDLKISEVKKSKKDGAPQKAAKKPQQPKKKVTQLLQGNG
jgi:hypothetical protein